MVHLFVDTKIGEQAAFRYPSDSKWANNKEHLTLIIGDEFQLFYGHTEIKMHRFKMCALQLRHF